jgi:hypothetical protein
VTTYDDDANSPGRDIDPWHAQVPNVHRWLNGHRGRPFRRDYPSDGIQIGYWFPPFYVMRALLGWRDLASGVASALTEPVEPSGPAEVLVKAWDEATLGSLGWWAWTNPHRYDCEPSRVFEKLRYPERFRGVAEWNGFTGGTDPKHLNRDFWLDDPMGHGIVDSVVSQNDAKCALIVDRTTGLLTALAAVSQRIPDARPAWVVHVTARDHGYLGGYRRCARCRRWFAGRYAPHAWGHTRDE